MRPDVTAGTAFPDYELPGHTGKPRRLSEIQAGDPMIIVLAREAYSAKDQCQHAGLARLWREMKPGVGTAGWSPSRPATRRRPTTTARAWARSGRSWPIRAALSSGQRGEINRFYAPELGWPPEVAVRAGR
ncbi:MAG: hypothetical protein ACM3ML_09455 [Micromonosporaceae bacterium]